MIYRDGTEEVQICENAESGRSRTNIRAIFCNDGDKKYFITLSPISKGEVLVRQGEERIKVTLVVPTHISMPCCVNAYTAYYMSLNDFEKKHKQINLDTVIKFKPTVQALLAYDHQQDSKKFKNMKAYNVVVDECGYINVPLWQCVKVHLMGDGRKLSETGTIYISEKDIKDLDEIK